MARNWANFLNEASRGYGLGFERYQAFDEARRDRQRRALMSDVTGALEDADRAVNPYFGDPYQETPPTGLAGAAGTTPPAAARSALPTATPVAQSALPSLPAEPAPTQRPTVAPTAFRADQYEPISVDGRPGTPRDATSTLPYGYTQSPFAAPPKEDVQVPLRRSDMPAAPRPKAEPRAAKPAAVDVPPAADQKATDKAHAARAVEDVAALEPAAARTMRKMTANTTTRLDAYERAKSKLREVYAMDGNIEGLLTLDQRFDEMQRTKMLNHMEQALQLYSVDPQRAAQELYRAYTYLPDGADIDIRMDQDGSIYAMGYDERTGDFRGGMQLTAEGLASLYRHYSDPAQFQQDMFALRMETEQREYDRGQDRKGWWAKENELRLKAYEAAINAAVGREQAAYYRARAEAELTNAYGPGAAGVDPADLRNGFKDIEGRLDDWMANPAMMPEPFNTLVDPDGKFPLSPVVVGTISQSLFANNWRGPMLSADEELMQGTMVAFADSLASGRLGGTNSASDRRVREQYRAALEQLPVMVVGDTSDGMLVLDINGVERFLPMNKAPGLRRLAEKALQEGRPVSAAELLPPDKPLEPMVQGLLSDQLKAL